MLGGSERDARGSVALLPPKSSDQFGRPVNQAWKQSSGRRRGEKTSPAVTGFLGQDPPPPMQMVPGTFGAPVSRPVSQTFTRCRQCSFGHEGFLSASRS